MFLYNLIIDICSCLMRAVNYYLYLYHFTINVLLYYYDNAKESRNKTQPNTYFDDERLLPPHVCVVCYPICTFHVQSASTTLYPPPWPLGSHPLSPPMQPLSESPILELTEQMESI